MTEIYIKELQELKPWDEIQGIEEDKSGYQFIYTAGHGYLVVPKEDKNAGIAGTICKYGFEGQNAFYLEEDCEYSEFLKAIKL